MSLEGKTAPDFTLPRDGGGELTLSSLRPSKVVLYFYPKDDTPGCTIEANEFTALIDQFAAADTVVLGVSKDTCEKHQKFIKKRDLKVDLLADTSGELCELPCSLISLPTHCLTWLSGRAPWKPSTGWPFLNA